MQICSNDPPTGFFRDGCCRSGAEDYGLHLVCAEMNPEFLHFSKDRWCLCVQRWKEALIAGIAPKVDLNATHISTLEFVDLSDLEQHSL